MVPTGLGRLSRRIGAVGRAGRTRVALPGRRTWWRRLRSSAPADRVVGPRRPGPTPVGDLRGPDQPWTMASTRVPPGCVVVGVDDSEDSVRAVHWAAGQALLE